MMERNFYFRLRFAFQNYLHMMLGGKADPAMVEDLLAIVEQAQKETRQ